MDTDIKYAHPLNGYLRRADKQLPLVMRADSPLPPRDLFTDHPAVIAEYDELDRLNSAARDNYRQAHHKRTEAEQQRRDYKAAVGKAMEDGKDPAKIKAPQDARLEAEAEQHIRFADQAKSRAERQGIVLGKAIQSIAGDLIPAAEDRMTTAALEVTDTLTSLRPLLERWAEAWQLRQWLSEAMFKGGTRTWHEPSLPAPIRDALATLASSTSGDLDRLRSDEETITQWRAQEARATQQAQPTQPAPKRIAR